MKCLVVALLLALTVQACFVPSMASTAQTNGVTTMSYSVGAILGITNVDVILHVVSAGRRRRRRSGRRRRQNLADKFLVGVGK